MEWYQVVKLPSATIPCFFRLLFIERKRKGLIFGRKRLDRVVLETKWLRLCTYQAIRIVPVDTNGMRWYRGIPIFLSSFLLLPPYNPLLLSIYLSNSPLKQINCLRPPRPANTTSGISYKALLAEYRQTVQQTYTLRHPLSSGAPRRPGDLQR